MTRRRAVILGAIALAAAGLAIFALTRPEKVRVPTVIGKPLPEAQDILDRKGFEVSVSTAATCAPEDTVTEQQPLAGEEADDGSTVRLTVSLGRSVQVPSVEGRPLAEARQRLDREDLFIAEVQQRASSNVKPNHAIGTDPPAGESVPCESEVTLVISEGADLVTLPNLLGQQQESAEAELRRLGLIPNVETRNADQPEGEVIGQDPGPGSRLEKDTQVTIIVSTGAGSIVVPSVEGQPESTAINILQGAGLTNLRVVRQTTDVESDDGRVTDQAPPSGTRQPAGQRVTIFVGKFEAPPEPEPPPTTTTPTEPPKR